MNEQHFLDRLNNTPEQINFDETMAVIDANYTFTPAAFRNGDQLNNPGQNSGSCKLFAFAKLNNLSEQKTLHCFGDYYREDVLNNPNGDDHQNIRNFVVSGWPGIAFDVAPLSRKS